MHSTNKKEIKYYDSSKTCTAWTAMIQRFPLYSRKPASVVQKSVKSVQNIPQLCLTANNTPSILRKQLSADYTYGQSVNILRENALYNPEIIYSDVWRQ